MFPVLLFIFCNALYIVQTEDFFLHFVTDNSVETIELFKLKRNVPALTSGKETDNDTIQPSNKLLIDNILVSPDGLIVFEDYSFNIDSLEKETKIYKHVIFQTQRRSETIKKHNVVIFLVFLDLKIIDSRTLYTRIETFSYVYFPFSLSKCLSIKGNTIRLYDKIYTFNENIVAVYDTIDYNGVTYMNKIYTNNNLQLYTPKVVFLKVYNFKYLILLALPVLLLWYNKQKKIKLMNIDYETEFYTIYYGTYNNAPAIIKKYKHKNNSFYDEIGLLGRLDHSSIKKNLYYDKGLYRPYMVFEYSDRVKHMTKGDLLQFTQVIAYLHEQNLVYKNFTPNNIRRKNGRIVLFNIGSQSDNTGWYVCTTDSDEFSQDLQSVGVILHYFITGYHPYETLVDDNETFKFVYRTNDDYKKEFSVDNKTVTLKNYTREQLEELEQNMKIRRYKIRTVNSLEHDLIYHTIKNKTTMAKLAKHPYFWSQERIFNFLANFSDLVEGSSSQIRRLERNKNRIFEMPWDNYLDDIVKDELEVFRYYNYNNARDLIRVIRNKGRHYNQIPEVVQEIYKSFPNGFIDYWMTIFPKLLIVCYNCGESLKDNDLLKDFY